MTAASHPSDPISHLWRQARAWLAEMLADFTSPAYVARAVARHARVAFRSRLQLLESLVMKLLLIEASRSHPFPGRRGSSAEAPRAKAEAASPGPMNTSGAGVATVAVDSTMPVSMGPGLGAVRQSGNGWIEHPAHPITWRVRFHTPKPRRSPPSSTRRVPPARTPACAQTLALRLARRFEALRRVIADPRRAIAALARKLHALGAAARAFARRIALSSPRQGGGPILADAIVRACDASFELPCDST